VKARWLAVVPLAVGVRAALVQLTVFPWRRYWQRRGTGAGLLIVALGDSLTQGIGSSRPSTSWLAVFLDRIEVGWGREVRIDNRAVYGARLADVLAKQLPVPDAAKLVMLCIGANDAGRTPPEEFARGFREVCSMLPIGTIVGDLPKFHWGPRIGPAAVLSQLIRTIVAEFPHLTLAGVERHTAQTRISTDLAGDYFHPNDRGYAHIADAFIEAAGLHPETAGASQRVS
jgi:acyl-CoA thioesterase-1